MPCWGDILEETDSYVDEDGNEVAGLSCGELREKYLKKLAKLTGRNVIAYYSSWLSTDSEDDNLYINDSDLTGFMNAIYDMDASKGLDLILHTPGGSAEAAEGIVKYLRSKFGNDIRVFIPQLAMSAGTMLACAGKEIVMGSHSFVGPIDAQYGGLSSFNIIRQFDEAKEDLSYGDTNETYWRMQLDRYAPGQYYSAQDAIELGSELVKEWLTSCMFAGDDPTETSEKINNILDTLNHNNSSHGRHFGIDDCRAMGLKVVALEDDNKLQDAVLSVHHAYTISMDGSRVVKYIENQLGGCYICNGRDLD